MVGEWVAAPRHMVIHPFLTTEESKPELADGLLLLVGEEVLIAFAHCLSLVSHEAVDDSLVNALCGQVAREGVAEAVKTYAFKRRSVCELAELVVAEIPVSYTHLRAHET